MENTTSTKYLVRVTRFTLKQIIVKSKKKEEDNPSLKKNGVVVNKENDPDIAVETYKNGEEDEARPWRCPAMENASQENAVVVKTEPESDEENENETDTSGGAEVNTEEDGFDTVIKEEVDSCEEENEDSGEGPMDLTSGDELDAAIEREKKRLMRLQEERKLRWRKREEDRAIMEVLSGEELEKFLEKKRLKQKKQLERTKQNMTEERKQQLRFCAKWKLQMKLAQMTDEERRAWTAKNTEMARRWRENLKGEKLEKYREYVRQRQRMKKYRYNPDGDKEKRNERYRRQIAKQTPEQRQKRLRRYQIYQAMTKLRKQCEDEGITEEEIENRVEDLKTRMVAEPLPPLETLSTYEPRPRKSSTETARKPRKQPARQKTYFPFKRRGRPRMVLNEPPDDDNREPEPIQKVAATANTTIPFETEPETNLAMIEYKCPHCTSSYSVKTELIFHASREHSKLCLRCPKCCGKFLNRADLQEHFKMEHTDSGDRKPILRTYPAAKKKLAASSTSTSQTQTESMPTGTSNDTSNSNCSILILGL